MKSRHVASIAGGIALMAAGFVSAQSVPVTVSNQGSTAAPTAGASGVTLSTFTLATTQSGSAGDISVVSIPLTFSASSGAAVSNLSSCQIFNSGGTALTTGGNVLNSPVSGTNTITFDMPLQISGGTSVSLTVRCNIASNAPSGGTFVVTAGTPNLTSSASSLGVTLNATPVVRPGAQDTLFALITLSGNQLSSAAQISTLPLSASFGGGASAGSIADCRVRNVNNLATPLNNLSNNMIGITEGGNSIPLDVPLQIPAGSNVILALTCDVAASAPSGGTVLLGTNPSFYAATIAGSSTSVPATTGTTPNGNAGSTSGSVLISSTAPTAPGPVIPGVPNTGMGEDLNLMVLAASAIAAFFGMMLLRRRTL